MLAPARPRRPQPRRARWLRSAGASRLLGPVLGLAGEQEDEQSDEAGVRRQRALPRELRRGDRVFEQALGLRETRRAASGLTQVGEEREALAALRRQRRRGAEQELRGRAHVSADEGTATGRAESPGRLGADSSACASRIPSSTRLPMCLLEVIRGDLLELDRPVAVHTVAPLDEALMEGGARAFQKTLVDAVADEDVLEPEAVSAGGRTASGSARRAAVRPARRRSRRRARRSAGCWKIVTDDRGRIDHSPLLALQSVEPRGQEGMDRRRDPARAVAHRARHVPSSKRSSCSSIIIDRSCSTNSGLPCGRLDDACHVRRRRCSASPSRLSITWATAPAESGVSANRCTSTHSGRDSSKSGRATHRIERRRLLGRGDDVIDEVEQSRLRPVKVLEHEHERPAPRQDLHELTRRPKHLRRGVLHSERPTAEARRSKTSSFFAPRRAASFDRAAARSSASSMSGCRPKRLDERPERDSVAIRQTAAANHQARSHAASQTCSIERDFPTPASPVITSRSHLRESTARARRVGDCGRLCFPPDEGRTVDAFAAGRGRRRGGMPARAPPCP